MQLIEAIKARRAIRQFKPDTVSDAFIKELLDAARLAPSGTNLQPWRFVVVKSNEAKTKLGEGTPLPFVSQAPVVIACCVDSLALATVGQRLKELREAGALSGTPLEEPNSSSFSKRPSMDEATTKAYLWLNAAIAIDHITLRAVDLGLGTCWVMMFDQDKVKKALDLEDRYSVVALIPVGYPDHNPAPRPRMTLDEIILKEL